MADFYSLKDFADGPHMVADPKGKWAWAADLAAARAEIERLTARAEKAEAERDEALARVAMAFRMATKHGPRSAMALSMAVRQWDGFWPAPVLERDVEVAVDLITAQAEENQRLRDALSDTVSVAEQDGWEKAMTGRQLILKCARSALSSTGEKG
ncbi:hypothetical protein HYQ43_04485 [Paracoccus pantotrophus]|uniref:Uncharacterized protein n=1 Tax=Paracoccus pantotrophus TaxID=82367 RepID=A0A7H9BRA1_PARPN|nr:hypothetical protein [Paracoccus pantotrophus]QLH13543.1 hypothetical protein HYQ43_04485 [Paracoccus pantotrophus]